MKNKKNKSSLLVGELIISSDSYLGYVKEGGFGDKLQLYLVEWIKIIEREDIPERLLDDSWCADLDNRTDKETEFPMTSYHTADSIQRGIERKKVFLDALGAAGSFPQQ